jgi:hypothetical protein
MSLLRLLESGLAAWRISHMLVHEAGPFDMFVKLRSKFGIEHDENDVPILWPHGVVFECVWCLSVWIAFVMMFMPKSVNRLFAVAAIAAMIESKYGIRNN